MGIRKFYPTRWTVRGESISSIIENYTILNQLWDECLEKRLDPDVKGRIIGVKTQMAKFSLLFGLHLSERILKITDNLSKTLQKESLSASEAQYIANHTVKPLKPMRSDEISELFYKHVQCLRVHTHIEEPSLPRKRRAPSRFKVGEGDGYHSPTVEDHYRKLYFEVLDLAISSIQGRFDQPRYAVYQNLEEV